ncbi:hypothetical protein ILUMI_02099 [Ignelater luminosus]|uniref:Toll-like receptor 3 n=1 Tax=Ignelater luminosus TaxID=2038154 RepID=A0A8K0DIC6_IGNLU|nr:hypothetical protein ILUMI_02099 [Ignelater luminosus]
MVKIGMLTILFSWLTISSTISITVHRDGCIYNRRRSAVNCRGENWSSVPFSFLQNKSFRTLDLGFNNIRLLNNTQDFLQVQSRDLIDAILLDNNQIEDLPLRLFDGLTNLQVLDLSYNRIKHISNNFCHITSLSNLILDGNPIESISKNAFVCMKNLKYLSLANCNITRFSFDTLESLNAKEINLSGNNIENVNDVRSSSIKL